MTTMSSRPRATMRDVAALAGVSLKTVSRVMNDEPSVAVATRAQVQRAADRLDYQLDLTAGSLRRTGRRTLSIGLQLSSVANPYSAAVHRAVEDAMTRRGIAVFAASVDDEPDRERPLVRAMMARRVDGLVLSCIASSQAYLAEDRRHCPMVFVDRAPVELPADTVLADHREGGRLAAEHFLARGHRRLAIITDREIISTAAARRDGFCRAAAAAGLASDPAHGDGVRVVGGAHDSNRAQQITKALLTGENPPTAIFSAQNLITVGAVRALHELGLQHRVALVGFDDIELADLVDPGITCIAQDPSLIGRIAADMLLARIDGDTGDWRTEVVPVELTARGSGEIPAG